MKKRLFSLFLTFILLATIPLSAYWKYNPFTRKLDYYAMNIALTGAGEVAGDVLYYDGTNWTNLPIGAATNVLTVVAGIPGWVAAGAPGAHAATHELLGADLLDHDNLTNYVAGEHLAVGAIDHDSLLNYVAGDHIGLPSTIAVVLTDHDLAAHTGLGLAITAHAMATHSDEDIFSYSTTGSITSSGAGGVTSGDNANAGSFVVYDGTNHKQTISTGALAGDITFVLPVDDGANLDFLQTNGAGTLAWVAGGGGDAFTVKVDAGAVAGYLGVAFDDGVLRTSNSIGWTDGGNFVTLDVTEANVDHGALAGLADKDHLLNGIGNPDGNVQFNMTTRQVRFLFTNPATADGGFEIEASGAFSGDLVHIHQHTGNPGAVDLMHLEADDADVVPLRVTGAGTYDAIIGKLSITGISNFAGTAAWNGQNITGLNSIYLIEQAEADADIGGSGQIWVDAGNPNTLWFTDEDGTDLQLGVGGDAFTLKVDAGAAADYFGVAGGDGLFRFTANQFTMADGGNFVTLSLADHATARTALGLQIGNDVQAQNAVLAELTALTDPAADEFPFWNDTTNNFEFSTVLFPTATGVTVGAAGNAGKLEIEDATGDVLAIQVGVQAGNTTYTWPTAFGTTGWILSSTDAGTMSWVANASDAFTLKVDAGAVAGYFGVAGGDGIFRFTADHFTMADGGDFVTLSLADHATARTALGLAIGTDVQDWDTDLDTYAGISPSANVQTLLSNATFALFLADLSTTAAAAFDWGGQNLTNVGSIAPTSVDSGGVITAASYIAIEDTNELRFYDNGNYVGFEPGALEANQIWVLPIADGVAGQVMQTSGGGGGTLTWVNNASGSMATDALWAAQGDLAYGNADDTGVILSFDYEGDFLRLNATVPYWDAPGIADTNPVVIDHGEVADDEYARFTANGLESRTPAELMTDLPAATTGAPGKSELATTAEVSAGVDTTRAVTADALAGSTLGRKSMIWKLTANDEVIVDQDDYDSILVPADFAGWLITGVAARIVTADDGADFIDIGIYNVTQTAEILSTLMRVEAGEWSTLTSAQPGVIDVGEDDITAADVIRIDVDYGGDNCTGLEVHITFERVT